jgi:hypothetical protein
MLVMLGFDESALIRSLRQVEPASSFRTTFAYTNITHLLASRIVAKAGGRPGMEFGSPAGTARSPRHEGLLLHGRSDRRGRQSCERASLDAGGYHRGAQREAQERLARLVPNTKHITNTNSGHEIHKEQPQIVIDSIREVVDAVLSGSRLAR